MKRKISVAMAFVMLLTILSACTKIDDGSSSEAVAKKDDGKKTAGICIPEGSEFFLLIGDQVQAALEEEGYSVQVTNANDDTQTMVKQIQNFTTQGVDILYVFPAGDAAAFHDVMQQATDSGIKTVVSHNNTGEGTATAFVQCDEFIMGTMMAPMVSAWVDKTFPDAGKGEIKVAVFEQSLIPDMVKRSAGMKIIAERFLRKVDLTTGKYVKTEGDAVTYTDKDGQEKAVDEPTGGLILDDNGKAQLNPFYNEKVKLIEISNRTIGAEIDAQDALDLLVTADNGVNQDVKAVMCYAGSAAVGASEKMLGLVSSGVIKEDLSKLAVFGADLTDSNVERIKQSADNTSLVRGVMTNGNIVQTIIDTVSASAKGEEVPLQQWEDLGYLTLNEDQTDTVQTLYNNELPETSAFFE